MIRFGIVTESKPGFARVEFEEDTIVTDYLPIIVFSSVDKPLARHDVGEQVACIMDETLDDGVILGAIYSEADKPSPAEVGVHGVEYRDGTKITYDTEQSEYNINLGSVEYTISKAGITIKKGNETLKKIMLDLLSALTKETHQTPAGPSSPPTNVAEYIMLTQRITNFFG